MSCPTAKSWFAPDEVYNLTWEDYVFCNQDVIAIKRLTTDMMEHMNCEECNNCDCKALKTYFDYLQYGTRWLFDSNGGGLIIYMDSNENDANHKQHLIEMRAKETPEETTDMSRMARHTLREYLRMLKLPTDSDTDSYAGDDVRWSEICNLSEYGYLGPHIIDCVVTQKRPEEKQNMLTWMSGQTGLKYIRPTMLFIGVLWNALSTSSQPTPGLTCAYDLMKNLIIVKTITYESGKHPLATLWPTEKSEDGFYLGATPKDFPQIMKDAEARKGPEDTAFWLHVILLGFIGRWGLRHSEALGLSAQECEDLTKHLELIQTDLEKAPLPSYEKPKPVEKTEVAQALEDLLFDLQFGEGRIRDVAVMAKEAGMVATAEALAENFARSVADMKRIIEHPEKPSKK